MDLKEQYEKLLRYSMILKYEWKKIVCNRINQIAMLIGYIIMAVTVIVSIKSEYSYVYQKGITHQGIEAVKYEQQFAKDQTDYLTEDYLTGQLQKLQQMNLDLESDDGFLTAQDEFGSLFMYLMNSYSDIHNTQYEYDRLNELDLSNDADFYERRIQKLTNYLNLYHEEGNYNDAEKDYWISHAKSVTTPFKWGSTIVVEFYRNVLGLGFYLMLVIAICVASVEIPYSMTMGQLMLLQLLASFAMIILTGD